ncbi:beta-ribofuranosylaminobenzene 5'-phosphate synthase family protein [Halobaculum gomorrense]|uniref:Beta-ribofuranosylaminobenzene 5'-phosphate synthase n=1 Tax=Halobaculum gomorrense TaxID=43928 RepID=A0A1M5MDY5_9EURY|nr:beta-ribofuranosylaminobenzene 5'-phosphate synthase family protein [Halobaculum gomorrense]SHG75495.1 beta-ribofuranosylaminobenzene 5'-phosphate synthase [Halobaculum gomorrense]
MSDDTHARRTDAPAVTVESGARLHFGFGTLSLAHERLYGAVGVGLDAPRVRLRVAPADAVESDHGTAREYTARACDLLGVDGARVAVEAELPRHMGLGSGTQLALATLAGVARAHDLDPTVRDRAPELGRGGRSGVGVATFENGGFVLDAGHPTGRFTTDRPADGDWTVPAVAARHRVPDHWRFLLVIPEADPGRAGDDEDSAIRRAVEDADPAVADRVAGVIQRRLLPAVAEGSAERFGAAVEEVGRLNGAWFADEQGGVYRPPVGDIVAEIGDDPAVYGAGQSSWGPVVYGVTDANRADGAREAGADALAAAGVDGEVRVVRPRNRGAEIGADRHNA